MKSVHLRLSQTRLDNVTKCTYLGFTISASGTFSYGIRKLIDEAKRACFAIRRIMVKSKLKNIRTYSTLFDNVVKPIALYPCEVWGKRVKLEENIEKIMNKGWEKLHTKVCKNITTLTEIGRYPMYIDIHTKMTKYLMRLKNIGKERLVCKAYQEQLNETENRNHWVWKMKEILDKDGYSYIFLGMTENETEITEGVRSLSNKIKFKGKEIFEQK